MHLFFFFFKVDVSQIFKDNSGDSLCFYFCIDKGMNHFILYWQHKNYNVAYMNQICRFNDLWSHWITVIYISRGFLTIFGCLWLALGHFWMVADSFREFWSVAYFFTNLKFRVYLFSVVMLKPVIETLRFLMIMNMISQH